ncbi:MAG TPA: LytR C-terminal domain-containing protein, partial [bacterium]
PEKPTATGKKATADSLKTVTGSMVAALNKPAPAPLLTADMPPPSEIQIQVLNGCGTPGVAGKVRGVLRQRGFDVLSFGNANSQSYEGTVIWARSELPFSELAARRLANSLGISADQVSIHENLGMGDIDVTLILGSDYQKLNLTAR